MTGWSLRGRLTASVAALVTVVVAALAWLVLAVVERAAWRQFDGGLGQRAQAWSALVEHDEDGYEMELPPPAGRPTYVEVWCPDETLLARSPSLRGADLPRVAPGDTLTLTLPDGRDGRATAIRFVPRDEHGGAPAPCRLVLAEGTEDVAAAVARGRRWSLAIALGALALAIALTSALIGHAVRPLTELGAQLEAIDDTKLATRVALLAPPRELEAPIARLNQLLARLDAAFARERQFTADVSHELRTPLAGLRAVLEVSELTAATPGADRAAIERALGVVIELSGLVERLLALSRAEAGQLRSEREPLPLRALIDDVWRDHAPAAAARGVAFRNQLAADAEIATDRTLATVVLGNLLANAAAYTEAGGWIEVAAAGGAIVEVIDSGPPIPDAHLPRLFDRMWRADVARSGPGGHAGLGLAVARAVAATLGWRVEARHRADGAVVFRVGPA